MYHVLLYYKITKIPNVEAEVKLHKEICKALQLTGRILLSPDGINGTVGGSKESIDLYRAYMNQHRVFKDIDFKESTSVVKPFPKMQIRAREEIITTEAIQKIDWSLRAKHVDRDEFHKWLQRGEDMVLLDMRNDYEWEIGRFVGSVRPPMKYFRDLKDHLEWYVQEFKGKKIVTFCTGGIRCEPATAMLVAAGIDRENIYQLEGGIVKYGEKYGNEGFYEGKCFVFDDRVAVPINTLPTAPIIGNCLHCTVSCDHYRNCANKFCNKLFIACDSCNESFENTCTSDCEAMIQNEKNIRPPTAVTVKAMHRNK